MTLALPACSAAGFAWVAAAGGCTAVGLQLGLQSIFDRSSDPILSKAAGVNAHSAMNLMVEQSIQTIDPRLSLPVSHLP